MSFRLRGYPCLSFDCPHSIRPHRVSWGHLGTVSQVSQGDADGLRPPPPDQCQFSWCPLSQDLDEMCVYISGVVEVLMLFQVTEIDFDFTDSEGELPAKMQKEFIDLTIGQIWEADDEDDLVEEITAATGWRINSLNYQHVLADF